MNVAALLLFATAFIAPQNSGRTYTFHLSAHGGQYTLSESAAHESNGGFGLPAYATCGGTDCALNVGPVGISIGPAARKDREPMDFSVVAVDERTATIGCLAAKCLVFTLDKNVTLDHGATTDVAPESDLTITARSETP